MKILIDTNLLLAVANASHVHNRVAGLAAQQLLAARHDLFIVPQNLYELWVVLTRPVKANGFEFSVIEAEAELNKQRQMFKLLADLPGMFATWQQLVIQHDVRGKTAHDTRLVAAMLVHGVDAILTFNGSDFRRYGVLVLDPDAVSGGAIP